MRYVKERFTQLEEAVAQLEERAGGGEAYGGTVRPETRLRGASRRGRVKPGTIEKHLGKDAEWVTINGVHVLINKETGEPIIGPDKIVRQRAAGQRNLDKVFKGKKHGFEVEDTWEDEGGKGKGDRDEKGRFRMKHKETGVDIPLSGVGVGAILAGLASFIDAAATLAATATVVVASKLESAIRKADDALQSWTID